MKLNKREKMMINKMQSLEHHVDVDEMWQSLSQYVPNNKKKKKRGFYFLLFSMVLLITGGLLYTVSDKNISKTIVNKNTSSNIQKTTVTQGNINSQKNIITKDDIDNENAENITKPILNKDNKAIKIKKNVERKINTNSSDDYVKRIEESKDQKHPIVLNSRMKNTEFSAKDKSVFIAKSSSNAIKTSNGQVNLHKRKYLLFKYIIVPKLLLKHHKRILANKPVNSLNLSRKKILLNIGVNLGNINQGFYSRKSTDNDYSSYLDSVSASKAALGINVGVDYYLSNRLFINSGFCFSRLTTRLQSLKEEEVIIEKRSAALVITKDNLYRITAYNYHYLLDIPLSIGYNIIQKRYYNISIETGAIFNLHTYSNGMYIDSNYEPVNYTNTKKNPYDSRFNIGWRSSLNIDFRLKYGYWLYIKSGLLSKRINYSDTELNIDEKYRILDLNVGMKYLL